jgi:hypothetical protein
MIDDAGLDMVACKPGGTILRGLLVIQEWIKALVAISYVVTNFYLCYPG